MDRHPLWVNMDGILNNQASSLLVFSSNPIIHDLVVKKTLEITHVLIERYGDKLLPDHRMVMKSPLMRYEDNGETHDVIAVSRVLQTQFDLFDAAPIISTVDSIFEELHENILKHSNMVYYPYHLVTPSGVDSRKNVYGIITRYGLYERP